MKTCGKMRDIFMKLGRSGLEVKDNITGCSDGKSYLAMEAFSKLAVTGAIR